MGDGEPPARHRTGRERTQRRRVADDGDPAPGGQGLVDDELGHVEELVHVRDADAAGLAQHGAEDRGPHLGPSHPVPGGRAVGRHTGLHDDDRLDPAEVAGDARELARVAHGLEVEAHRMGVVVVDPVLHEVVAGDVDPVAGRPERRDAELAAGRGREDRDAQGTGLGEEPEVTRGRHVW